MSAPQTLSVALTTYNGERFIEQQLDSIFAQTRLPDEIVICDDHPSDATVEKLAAYQQKYPNVVKLHQNERNLGFIRNFEKAVSLCSGDIIVLCDQDDVWFPYKLERILDVFAREPACGFVFSDAVVTNELLEPKGYNVYDRYVKPDLRPGKTLPDLIHKIDLLGCTSAFRAEYRPYLMPFSDVWGHDHWIVLIMAIISQICMIDMPLLYYRRHSSNIGNPAAWRMNIREIVRQKYVGLLARTYERDCRRWRDVYQHLLKLRTVVNPLFSTTKLEEGIAAVKARLDFAENRLAVKNRSRLIRLPLALHLLKNGDYTRYMRGRRTLLKDLII